MQVQPEDGAGNSMKNANDERDFEEFMQDLEENPDLRSGIDLYRNPAFKTAKVRSVLCGHGILCLMSVF